MRDDGVANGPEPRRTIRVASPHRPRRVPLPRLDLYRIAVCGGPIIIATMALAYQVSPMYVITYLTLVAARRVVMRATSPQTIPSETLKGAAGIYLLFLTIMSACMVFTSWSSASDKL